MLGEKTTHGRTRPIAGYETNTLRGDGYEVADPKDEIPLAMKPGSHGNQADDVFVSFPSKNLGLQSFHKPRECQTAMPVILFILVPQRY